MVKMLKLFPQHAGIWEGKYTRLSSDGRIYQEFNSKLVLLLHNHEWRQINEYTHNDGMVEFFDFGTSFFDSTGVLHFDTPRLVGKSWEGDENIFVVWTLRDYPGSRHFETITLLGDRHRVRTWQHTRNGVFEGLTMIEEYQTYKQSEISEQQLLLLMAGKSIAL